MKIDIDESAFAANDQTAAENRSRLAEAKVLAVNLLSGPGAGKTTLLEATIDRLKDRLRMAVIEGDVATTNDADRIAAHGVPALQITTEQLSAACHLDARMVSQALDRLPLAEIELLFIENVGNMVCPAAFDLGEAVRVAILSVTEGEDKPLKYPRLFRDCQAAVISKIDIAPHLDCDLGTIYANIRTIQPAAQQFPLSATSGDGMSEWVEWLEAQRAGHLLGLSSNSED